MSIVVKNTESLAIEEEVTEGTWVTPASASSYVQCLSEGLEINPSKELLERNVATGSIGKITPRTGTKSVSGAVPCELRAFSTQGSAPEFDKLIKAALGTKRTIATTTTTKAAGNTASSLKIEDADISKFTVGDIVMTLSPGAYHVSPISTVTTTGGSAAIGLLVPHPSGDHPDSVVIAKMTCYTVAESGHKTLSITRYQDSLIQTKAIGCRPSSLEISNFATGQIPEVSFGFDGLDFEESETAPSYSPSYDSALPPIVLDARAYLDGSEIVINELAVSVENTVGFATSIAESNGKISSRIVERSVTGSFTPYKETDNTDNHTRFVNNTEFSLFAYAKNPTSTPGEFGNVVAVYMPKCIITEIAEADADGLVQHNLSFTASRGSAGTTNEVFIAFI